MNSKEKDAQLSIRDTTYCHHPFFHMAGLRIWSALLPCCHLPLMISKSPRPLSPWSSYDQIWKQIRHRRAGSSMERKEACQEARETTYHHRTCYLVSRCLPCHAALALTGPQLVAHASPHLHITTCLFTASYYRTTPHHGTASVANIAYARSLSLVLDLGAPRQRNGCSPR